ncbi:phage tail sheath C-terminal domain-containing protein [Adonisia turfae]|uniref:Phage tail sheath family protein n=2 Tax=Adonisia turfae TaxID=2950184 RepID=A0A6M0RDJ7_9CYAN|nr:phage tail sheath C-terminal domain-containing protein [Adonisia turfae]NEZ54359.1 phage tail sheath family protein [Adonisia turfae CCMR0081]
MPITPTYPGVYVEELPSGIRTITGVATSILAVVGYFTRGPVDSPVQLFNIGDFNRAFGGLNSNSEASYAIQQFFLNGGTEAWAVRVTTDAASASTAVINALTVEAISHGTWGDNVRFRVEPVGTAADEFNLIVSEYPADGGLVPLRQEVFQNLSMTVAQNNFVDAVVNDANTGSQLIQVTASGASLPEINGTLSAAHADDPTIPASPAVTVTIARPDGNGGTTLPATPAAVSLNLETGSRSLLEVAPALEAAIRATDPTEPAFAGATVTAVGDRLLVLAGPGNPRDVIGFTAGATSDALLLTSTPTASANIQEYILGGGAIAGSGQTAGAAGDNGALPGSTELIGDPTAKTGIHALEDVDLFNLLCIPRSAIVDGTGSLTAEQAGAVMTMAESYCRRRRALFLMDTPNNLSTPQAIKAWLGANNNLRSDHVALYFPQVKMPDPLNNFKLRTVGASGTIAGLYARIDSERGVWKAPAGTDATLSNVFGLDASLTDAENGTLNPLAINCLRTFPIYGTICWGARTLEGADAIGSEYKYVPVRRLALFIEETLFRSLKWVVFEPNDEPLWAQIRLNVGAFMNNLFRQGAFQGQTPRQAYLVKCDKETTTQNDINQGIVNILVGFAPLKPAEFVFIKLQQLAGQIQT